MKIQSKEYFSNNIQQLYNRWNNRHRINNRPKYAKATIRMVIVTYYTNDEDYCKDIQIVNRSYLNNNYLNNDTLKVIITI